MIWSVYRIHPLPGKTGQVQWVIKPSPRFSLMWPYQPKSPLGFGIAFDRLRQTYQQAQETP